MDATTSIVSLIQFTITGLVFIRQTFTSIKEGPELVTYVVKNAHNLLQVLQRLESNHAVKESKDVDLGVVLKSCCDDVRRMARKLEKLDFKASDKMGVKLFRSAKSGFKEKELMDFQVRLHEYSSSLTTFITIEDSDKLFEMNHKMDDSHRFIQEELISLSKKCDRIEIKCDEVGAAARNPQLQDTRIVDLVREILRDQLHQLIKQHDVANFYAETNDFQKPGATEGFALGPSTMVVDNDPRGRVDQLSNLASKWESDIGFESDATRGIIKDIGALVEAVKTLPVVAAMLETQARIGKGAIVRQNQGEFLYRELISTLNILRGPPVDIQVSRETRYNTPQASKKERYWDPDEVLANSRSLQNFFSRDRIRLTSVIDRPTMVNRQILTRLLQWSQTSSPSQMLWIMGGYTSMRDLENPMTRISLKLVNLAYELRPNVLMISYFCQLGASNSFPSDDGAKIDALTALIYALIRQILEILPPMLEMNIDLSETRFQSLDGTKETWMSSFLILKDLVCHIDQPMFCILDGLQWLEHSSTTNFLRKLLRILRHKYLYILFITTGASKSLYGIVSEDEIIRDVDIHAGVLKENLGRHGQKFWR